MHRLTIPCAFWWLVIVALCCRATAAEDGPQPGSPSEPVRLNLSMKIPRDVWIMTDWSQPPQVAVWLEDPSGSTVRTLFVTHRTGAGDWKGKAGCDVSLPYWVGRYNVETATSGPPTFQRPVADAITQPTPKESLMVTAVVPPGSEWDYFVEVNVSGDFNHAFPERLGNGRPDEAGNGQPSLVYRGHIKAVSGKKSMPALIGRTDQFRAVVKLSDELSGITTAKTLLSDIEMSCSASDPLSSDAETQEPAVRRPDVPFIVIEDLAAILGSYGHPVVRTPHIDRLAGHGVLFERSYVQAPVCNPSRASVSTGLRPETTGVDHNDIDWRGRIPKGHLTLPEFFQREGYETVTCGKIHHNENLFKPAIPDARLRENRMWDRWLTVRSKPYQTAPKRPRAPRPDWSDSNPANDYIYQSMEWGPSGLKDSEQADGAMALAVARELKTIRNPPRYLAVGLRAPHYPLRAPDAYYDWYPPESLKLAQNPADDLANVPYEYSPFNTTDDRWLNKVEKREVVASRIQWLIVTAMIAPLATTTLPALTHQKATADAVLTSLAPGDAELLERGKIEKGGVCTLWTDGVLGDWFVAPKDSQLEIVVTAAGQAIDGVGAKVAVEVLNPDGRVIRTDYLSVASPNFRYETRANDMYRDYSLRIPVQAGYFGLRLRHTNRLQGNEPTAEYRHLFIKAIAVRGARRAEVSADTCKFLEAVQAIPLGFPESGSTVEVSTDALELVVDPATATWTASTKFLGIKVANARPVFNIEGRDVDLREYAVAHRVEKVSDPQLGSGTRVMMEYARPGELDVTYTLFVRTASPDIVTQLDFSNRTSHALVVNSAASMVAQEVSMPGSPDTWRAIGDRKTYKEPYESCTVGAEHEFASWWYMAVQNQAQDATVVAANLTNNKGLGRFTVVPQETSMSLIAFNDYEGITMPPAANVTGERVLLHFGRKGTHALEHFGELVAKANDVKLARHYPIDPYDSKRRGIYNGWIAYGAAVKVGFDYSYDMSGEQGPGQDRNWVRRNWDVISSTRLDRFGYFGDARPFRNTCPTPLARRYGNPDFWYRHKLKDEHPEFYINGRIDFSNPAVREFEQSRVREFSNANPDKLASYFVDFTDLWRYDPGQHDPFMTSAETYRAAMLPYARLHEEHPGGAFGDICMNIPGLNYGLFGVLRVGQDSDRGYYERPGKSGLPHALGWGTQECTFTKGLVRQASGRWFYNGRVWWTNPDTFGLYAGGLYSGNRGKTNATFNAIAGNRILIGEPFCDEQIPPEHLDIACRVAPAMPEVSTPVDVFHNNPARVWNIPVTREYGSWNIVGLFNFDDDATGNTVTQRVDFADLDLSPDKEYLLYEFWNKRFLGVKKSSFEWTLGPADCEVVSIVEKKDHPLLVSTNRHVRQMSFDVLELDWDAETRTLSGTSLVVEDDRYQLRIYVPAGFSFVKATAGNLAATSQVKNQLLTVDFESNETSEVDWSVKFRRVER